MCIFVSDANHSFPSEVLWNSKTVILNTSLKNEVKLGESPQLLKFKPWSDLCMRQGFQHGYIYWCNSEVRCKKNTLKGALEEETCFKGLSPEAAKGRTGDIF